MGSHLMHWAHPTYRPPTPRSSQVLFHKTRSFSLVRQAERTQNSNCTSRPLTLCLSDRTTRSPEACCWFSEQPKEILRLYPTNADSQRQGNSVTLSLAVGVKKTDGQLTVTDKQTADEFCSYFSEVFVTEGNWNEDGRPMDRADGQ